MNRHVLYLAGCVAGAATLVSAPWRLAHAEETMDMLNDVWTSDGCGHVDAKVPAGGPLAGSLVLQLNDFSLQASRPASPPSPRVCKIRARVRVPARMAMRPVQAFVDGEVATSENGTAWVALEYAWRDWMVRADRWFGGDVLDAFVLPTEMAPDDAMTVCSNSDTETELTGRIELQASRGGPDLRNSDIAVSNTEASVRWIWSWSECDPGPLVGRRFRSRYQNPSGQWIHGTTVLDGATGWYRTNSGERGELFDITYEHNAEVARGRWRFQNGAEGWFEFVASAQGDSFDGSWGYGSRTGASRRGRWRGEAQ
jgi:hypothetical protein